jgi:hypothetical protein
MNPTTPSLRFTTLAALALAGTLLAPGDVEGAAAFSANAEVRLLDSPTTDIHSGTTGASSFAANVGGPANTHAAPTAWANANPGGVHLTAVATAQVFTPGPTARVYSSAEARGGFTDRFVINAPGLAGTLGSVSVALVISGSPTHSGGPASVPDGQGWGSASSWKVNFSLVSNGDGVYWDGNRSYSFDSNGTITDGTANFGAQPFTIPFVFGVPLDVALSGVVEARAGALSTIPGVAATLDSFASLDLGNTIAWGGILDLRDANGAPVTNFSATSADTGFDYAQAYAVPEPTACATLLCLAAPALAGRRKRADRLRGH